MLEEERGHTNVAKSGREWRSPKEGVLGWSSRRERERGYFGDDEGGKGDVQVAKATKAKLFASNKKLQHELMEK